MTRQHNYYLQIVITKNIYKTNYLLDKYKFLARNKEKQLV